GAVLHIDEDVIEGRGRESASDFGGAINLKAAAVDGFACQKALSGGIGSHEGNVSNIHSTAPESGTINCMPTYDAIVIGTGQSGPSLAVRLAKAGRKVAVIERYKFGGTCVNTGCIPTKTMVASARAAYAARHAADFGVVINGSVSVDMAAVMARKERVAGA